MAPGRGTVRARFVLTEQRVAEIRAQAAGGEKVLPEFQVEVRHAEGDALVALVRKTLYVRLKPRHRPREEMSWPYPRIVAHRGGGALAPENTLGAIRLGASMGFKGVEFDVMLAGDGTPVVIHDETVDRTTDGRGEVSKMSYAELSAFTINKTEKIPTLRRRRSSLPRTRALGQRRDQAREGARARDRRGGGAHDAGALARRAAARRCCRRSRSMRWRRRSEAAPELPRGYLVRQDSATTGATR